MTWKPFSDTPDEYVLLRCETVGAPDTEMWTRHVTYLGRVTGNSCGLIEVRDDLGYLRMLLNDKVPSFPMGTESAFGRVYTALFDRVVLPPQPHKSATEGSLMNTNLNRTITDYMYQCTAGASSHPGELESLKDGLEAVVEIVREVCGVLTDEQQTEIARLVGKRVYGYREDDV